MWNFPSLQQGGAGRAAAGERVRGRGRAPEYGLLARHGHEWDENTYGWRFRRDVLQPRERIDRFAPEAYETMAIGEAVTAELMSGLVFHARDQGAPDSLVSQLKEVNNLRPLLDVFAWLDWIARRAAAGAPGDAARSASASARGTARIESGPAVGPAADRLPGVGRPRRPARAGALGVARSQLRVVPRSGGDAAARAAAGAGAAAGRGRAAGGGPVGGGVPGRAHAGRHPARDLWTHPPRPARLLRREHRRHVPHVCQHRHVPPAHQPDPRRAQLRERATDDHGIRLPRRRGHAGEARRHHVHRHLERHPRKLTAEAPAHPVGTAAQRARAS